MSIWFTEELHPYYRKGIRIKRILADEQTQYQHLQVVETEFFGNAMILDGIIQLTERDNMGYHEMIAHVPMLAVGKPKRVLIVGGGDGGSLQQALRYPRWKKPSSANWTSAWWICRANTSPPLLGTRGLIRAPG
jgi:spermidine synthase